jgi:site-specific DNA-methyltransferase (adenine-specific)
MSRSKINLFNMDCMDFMRDKPDNYYEIAIVDPPYFETGGTPSYYNQTCSSSTSIKPTTVDWHLPDKAYFDELYRVSKDQIIWGCNYFTEFIPHISRIVWHKETSGDFSDCELASYSKHKRVTYFRYRWNGMIQENMKKKEARFHPTQKPVALYKWLLQNYAKEGDKILDTHGGSMSIAIACHDAGFDLDLCELDHDYFQAGKERLEKHQRQLQFDFS